jgi:hypothetical protein
MVKFGTLNASGRTDGKQDPIESTKFEFVGG